RAALAGSLLESLDTEVDEDAEAAWATEVNRRVAELDSGAVKDHSLGRSPPPTRRALMPSFAVEVHPLAADEAEGAERWYRERNERASIRFRGELDRGGDLI